MFILNILLLCFRKRFFTMSCFNRINICFLLIIFLSIPSLTTYILNRYKELLFFYYRNQNKDRLIKVIFKNLN